MLSPGERNRLAEGAPAPGDVLGGKYAIVRVLGEGGMGIVYEAVHQRLNQRVAIKLLMPSLLAHPVLVARFEREARAAAQLKGRNVARVSDVDVTESGLPFMVMELLDGHDLAVELHQRGRLPFDEAVDYVLQASCAMIEAHALGIVHRDLKPSNLFLVREDDRNVVKVLDFGISKSREEGDDAKLTDASVVMGTAHYMSPEQVRATHDVDGRTDVWSLGVILFECIAGRGPWMGTPTQVAAAIVTEDAPDIRTFGDAPEHVALVLRKALERDRARRFSDVRELVLSLSPFAPEGSAGRQAADAAMRSSAATKPGPSAFAVPPAAPSSSRLVIGDPARPDTAPGWSSPREGAGAARAIVVGVGTALVVGLAATGGVVLWSRRVPAHVTSTASSAASAEPGASLVTPPIPATPPTETAAPQASAPPTAEPPAPTPASPRVRAGAKKPTPAKSAAPAPSPTPTGSNGKPPLFL